MKKVLCGMLLLSLLFTLAACQEESSAPLVPIYNMVQTREKPIDVDLTKLSATMVYGEVFNMMTNSVAYQGKVIKMNGEYVYYHSPETDVSYFTVLIADAMGCCQQGIEFILDDSYHYPDDFPTPGENITVIGEFETYYEDEVPYHRLINGYRPTEK